ncbi:MAG: FGGY-family carbohydrate kinase [Gammaproteobacteria bacterium]|nr:FGGY-family carbohydrate kinase [Gammaproteobacteria bacterium]
MPITQETILTIDCGTQSIRALLFNRQGELLAKSQLPLGPYSEPQKGWVEQPAEYFWQKLCEVCQTLWASSPLPKNTLQAVALTTQRATLIHLDKDDNPLRPSILWLDRRRSEKVPSLPFFWRSLFKLVGAHQKIHSLQQEAEVNWVWAHQPDVLEKTDKCCLLSSYLIYQMTGDYTDSSASQVGFLPFDYQKQAWANLKDWRWKALAVEPHMLPVLKPPGSLLGTLTECASQATGIPRGLPVIAAGSDKACEVIGSGCMTSHQGAISFGTTVTLNIPSERYREPFRFAPAYPAILPEHYTLEYQIYRGFWLVHWFCEQFSVYGKEGEAPEAILEKEIANIPPGNEGLLLQPYWTPGLWFPPQEARGTLIGFSDVHKRGHIYKAILEGLVYALREGKEFLEKRTGVPLKEVRVSGGGSQSTILNQITADILGLPVIIPETFETAGLGAAIASAIGIEWYSTFQEAGESMVRIKEAKTPHLKARATYENAYRQIYKKLYPAVKPLYQRIAKT